MSDTVESIPGMIPAINTNNLVIVRNGKEEWSNTIAEATKNDVLLVYRIREPDIFIYADSAGYTLRGPKVGMPPAVYGRACPLTNLQRGIEAVKGMN